MVVNTYVVKSMEVFSVKK